MGQLSNEQIKRIEQHLSGFKSFLKSEKGVEWQKERVERRTLFTKLLGSPSEKVGLDRDLISQLSEEDFGLLIKSLWASQIWTNKDYLVHKIVEENDLAKIKIELKELLYGTDSIAHRYDRFRGNIKGLGASSLTEILHFFDSSKYCIWNIKPKRVLPFLGMENLLPKRVFTYSVSGEEYEKCIEVLDLVRMVLISNGIEKADFTDVDFFLAYLFYNVMKGEVGVSIPEAESEDFDHDEVVEKLGAIGSGLGFDIEYKKQIAKGAVVDLVWSTKIGNLGMVRYVFEVQRKGSIDSLILNLQKARKNPSVQKVVVVGGSVIVNQVRGEVEALGEDFRKSLAYLTVADVEKASSLLQEFNNVLSKLELFKLD